MPVWLKGKHRNYEIRSRRRGILRTIRGRLHSRNVVSKRRRIAASLQKDNSNACLRKRFLKPFEKLCRSPHAALSCATVVGAIGDAAIFKTRRFMPYGSA